MRGRKWTEGQLKSAVANSFSIRKVIQILGLKPTGGNYSQIKKYFREYEIDIKHFKGKLWNKGLTGTSHPRFSLEEILINDSNFQSYKLKRRLFVAKIKKEVCEECGWAERSEDGRIPLELDHINGNRRDNRIANLRILCPNCHSLKPTHRGRNINKI